MKRLLGLVLGLVGMVFVALPVSADTTSTLLPTSDGTYAQWTPKSGATHYTQVDEASCNGTTDYNSETTLNQRDSYGINISSVPNGAQITQIDITPCASKNSSGGSNSTINVFYRLNGVNSSDSTGYSVSGTTPVGLSTSTYSGLSNIKGGSTALEIGSVYTAGSKGARLGRIAAVITYTVFQSPSALSVVPSSTSSVQLNWEDNSTFEGGYRVERSLDGVSGWTQRGSDLAANSTSYTDTGLSQGTTYYYRVYAFNSGGNSGYSNVASVNTGIPLAPSVLSVTIASCGGLENIPVFLSWTDNSFNENFFEIERATDGGIPGSTFEFVATVGANMTSYEDSFTDCGYRVRAVNQYGSSAWAYTDIIN